MSADSSKLPVAALPAMEPVEEDDEFEEFKEETWGADKVSKEDQEDWAADWDDEDVETDFDKHLKAELQAAAAAGTAQQ